MYRAAWWKWVQLGTFIEGPGEHSIKPQRTVSFRQTPFGQTAIAIPFGASSTRSHKVTAQFLRGQARPDGGSLTQDAFEQEIYETFLNGLQTAASQTALTGLIQNYGHLVEILDRDMVGVTDAAFAAGPNVVMTMDIPAGYALSIGDIVHIVGTSGGQPVYDVTTVEAFSDLGGGNATVTVDLNQGFDTGAEIRQVAVWFPSCWLVNSPTADVGEYDGPERVGPVEVEFEGVDPIQRPLG